MASTRIALAAACFALAFAGAAAAQDASKGQAVYQDRCSQCHVLHGTGQGPSLVGVMGRKAASLPGYTAYSDALKASGIVWTPANIDRFVQSPTKMVPGTAMRAIVPNASDRADLIAYLATLKR